MSKRAEKRKKRLKHKQQRKSPESRKANPQAFAAEPKEPVCSDLSPAWRDFYRLVKNNILDSDGVKIRFP